MNLTIQDSIFKWKYPLWYTNNINVTNIQLHETTRSGLWYVNDFKISDSMLDAPKTFRYCQNGIIKNVSMHHALETLWNSKNITIENATINGDYFGFHSENIKMKHIKLDGNYCFDSGKNIELENSILMSKDAFWNCENVIVKDSIISGEYIGWNSKNLTFINCTIESLQGFCFIDKLTLINCKMIHSSLLFEYCTNLDVEIINTVESIKNPQSGKIRVYACHN